MLSPLKCVLVEYCTLLVKMYSDQFVKPIIVVAKVNYALMADIICLLTLAAMAYILLEPIFKALHNPPPCMYVISLGP